MLAGGPFREHAAGLVFVVSLGRSGSTFILRALEQIKGLTCYRTEWNLASSYADLVERDGNIPADALVRRYVQDGKALPEVAAVLPGRLGSWRVSPPDFLAAIRDILAGAESTLVIKTADLECLWLYKRLFPGARFIINVRHPLTYIQSWNLFWVALNYHMYPSHWLQPVHVEGAQRIRMCFHQAALHRHDRNTMVVRLEDLSVDEPEMAASLLKRIVEFCGASVDIGRARRLVADRAGINNRFCFSRKHEVYAAYGLTRLERMVLEKSVPFITPFYPEFSGELASTRYTFAVTRLLRYAKEQVRLVPAPQRPIVWLKWCYKAATLLRALVR